MMAEPEQTDANPFLSQTDKGNDSIVIQLGSHSIKFGLASQFQPFIIPNCIAYYNHNHSESNENAMKTDGNNDDNQVEISEAFLANLANIEQEVTKKDNKLDQKNKMGKKLVMLNAKIQQIKPQSETEIPERKNEQQPNSTGNYKKMELIASDLNEDIVDNNFKWTALTSHPDYLIGREALCLPDDSNYILHYPIKYGYFNNEYSFHSVINDLTKILSFCFIQVLAIPQIEFGNYNIVLLLPDLFIKIQVKALVNIFLKFFGFKNIFLHLESVMSTFGLAVQTACVVDIGSDKINICCVDEGMILEETLIRKNFGGDQITHMLFLMLTQASKNQKEGGFFPSEIFNIKNKQHFRIIEKLKENDCEFPSPQSITSQFIPKNSKIWYHKKGMNTKQFNISLSESAYISPLCLCYPEIIETFQKISLPIRDFYNDLTGDTYTDPEDLMAEIQKTLANADKKEENATNSINNFGLTSRKKSRDGDDDSLSQTPSKSEDSPSSVSEEKNTFAKKNTYESLFDLTTGIDDLICQSIMSVSNPELRKKMANAVILVGGTCKLKGFVDFLEDRLINKLCLLDTEIERVEIFNYPEIDIKTLTWIGGSILPKLDSAKDMWIQRERWIGEPERIDEIKEKPKEEKDKESKDKDIKTKEKEGTVATKDKDNKDITNKEESKNDNEGNEVKEVQKDKKKKIERHLDGGVKLIREKCPFIWS